MLKINPSIGKIITYELLILYRPLAKSALKPILKRTAQSIFDRGGIIRKINNLGTNTTPYKMSMGGTTYKQASYFMYEFHFPPANLFDLQDELQRDIDVVKKSIYKKNELINFECTLDEELQPAPYRKDVQELMALAKKKEKPKFEYNTGLDYYPFQK